MAAAMNPAPATKIKALTRIKSSDLESLVDPLGRCVTGSNNQENYY